VARKTFQLFDCSYKDITNLMDTVEIDPYFKEFLKNIEQKGHNIYILSDGYDLLIKQILSREGLEHLPFYSNSMIVEELDGSTAFDISLPYHNSECEFCGTCKTTLLKKLSSDQDEIIYIGDGHSDRCPIEHSHKVYAKDTLYQIAKDKEISAIKFTTFKEIIELEHPDIKPKNQND